MPLLQQTDVRNKLLLALPPEEFASLQPALRAEQMLLRQVVIPPHTAIQAAYFPEEGFVSITADGSHGRVEIGLVGREGVVGVGPILLGDDRSPHTHFVQMAGHMLSIDAKVLRAAVEQRPALRRLLHRFIQAQLVHRRRMGKDQYINTLKLFSGRRPYERAWGCCDGVPEYRFGSSGHPVCARRCVNFRRPLSAYEPESTTAP